MKNFLSFILFSIIFVQSQLAFSAAGIQPEQVNQIQIFVWKSHENAVGHVSMLVSPGTPNEIYISAWPGRFHTTFLQDVYAEDGLPHQMYTFFTDNIGMQHLRNEWNRIAPRLGQDPFDIYASVFGGFRGVDPQQECNCVCLVYHMMNIARPRDGNIRAWPFETVASDRFSSGFTLSYLGASAGVLGGGIAEFAGVAILGGPVVWGFAGLGMGIALLAYASESPSVFLTPNGLADRLERMHGAYIRQFDLSLTALYDTRNPSDYLNVNEQDGEDKLKSVVKNLKKR